MLRLWLRLRLLPLPTLLALRFISKPPGFLGSSNCTTVINQLYSLAKA